MHGKGNAEDQRQHAGPGMEREISLTKMMPHKRQETQMKKAILLQTTKKKLVRAELKELFHLFGVLST